ncbi:hypothetical protein FQN54_005641 [Arachnomyces sp. PD_36]|nr:hypothetical protein FQN54_005641 [Arachnomyces sp. PD_36]
MASPVDPQALNARLLALFNHTNSNSDASISRSRRSLVSDSTLSSTEVDPDTFFHRSLFDIADGEAIGGGLGPMKDMEPVVDTHLEEWTKSMADYWVRKRENDRKAALAGVEEERVNGQPFTGNLFEPQTPPSRPPPNSQMMYGGDKDLEFGSGNLEIVQDSASPVRFTQECYDEIPVTYKTEESGNGRTRSTRYPSNRQNNNRTRRQQQQPQPRSTNSKSNNTRPKPTALSQTNNNVLNGRVQKPHRPSNMSTSTKPIATRSTTSPRRSARIQEMKAKAQQQQKPKSVVTTSSPSRGQSKSTTKRPQKKRQAFRNSKAAAKPQGVSKPMARNNNRRARKSKG